MFACSQKKRDERKKNEENEKMGIRIKTKMNKKKRVRYYVERKGREKKKGGDSVVLKAAQPKFRAF